MVVVVPEYVMLPDNGAANCLSKVCVADAALSRPTALPNATITMPSGEFAFVNGTVIVAVVPDTFVVAPVIGLLFNAFFTCTAVTPEATVYVMLAVVPEYVMLPDRVGTANCLIKVCVADAALFPPTALLKAIATMSSGESASVNGTVIAAVFPETTAEAIILRGSTTTLEMVPTNTSGALFWIHPPTVTGPFADIMLDCIVAV
jgi:hypothetical protein